MSYSHNKKGFTLIEVMITVSLLSLVGISLMALLVSSLRGWSSGTSGEAATSSATVAVQKLSIDIRDGRSATINNGTLIITFPKKITDTSTHETIYDLSANDPVTRNYYISDGNLMRNVGGVITTMMRGVDAPTSEPAFGAGGGTVSINLVGKDQVGTKTSTLRVSARVSLRNYVH
ncbi:MAG: prepilin-type N-terminal cleavage/methylation domain-containing protein [Armatimonadota bacterium]|nr:prepilin-type N-terminal cleavage/methylation domain-containing protein [bacterium]